jgi:CBS domain-containing protein
MKVASILKAKGTHVETIPAATTVFTAAWNLKLNRIGALVVSEDGGTVQGVVSERDIVNALTEHGQQLQSLPVSRIMTAAVTCAAEDTITAAMALMTRRRARHLLVMDGGRLAGIISIGDVVKHRLGELELEANVLRETLMASH